MRWICYALCIGLVAIQMSYSMPASKENLESVKETLQNVDNDLEFTSLESGNRQKRTIGVFRRIFPELSKVHRDGDLMSSETNLTDLNAISALQASSNDSHRKTRTESSQVFQGEEETNGLFEEASEAKQVRVPFGSSDSDLQASASGEDNEKAESSQEELSDDIEISETGENSRSKRLGVFGNLFGGGDGSSGGEGGSGNFLFDIIRRTADGAARAAGTVYRLLAGTDNNGLWQGSYDGGHLEPSVAFDVAAQTPVTASAPTPPTTDFTGFAYPTLVAGSGATEQQDEDANAGTEQGHSSDDGYQTGIPGPITRLFVIANRGIANLVQDLILRLAQTSERLVNFKARLITAII